MTMRKFVVTLHKDGHITANEYEEPKLAYSLSDARAVRTGYRQAIQDVKAVLEYDLCKCEAYAKMDTFGDSWKSSYNGRRVECELLLAAVDKLNY